MIPDINRKVLNFILYEASRFNLKARETESPYQNYFAVEATWDEGGQERKQVFTHFDQYRLWWIREVVYKHYDDHTKFWKAMEKKRRDDTGSP